MPQPGFAKSSARARQTVKAGGGDSDARNVGAVNVEGGATNGQLSTRERILDIALDLFIEKGYEKTSLRDIAEQLGTTKAALYYHFERKQDILLELHLRLHALGNDAFGQLVALDSAEARIDAWPALIDSFMEQVISNPKLFLLHQRNRNAFRELEYNERHAAENDHLEQLMRNVLSSDAIPLEQRVRMACSVGAVMAALMSSLTFEGDGFFGDVPMPELAEIVRGAVRDLLGSSEMAAQAVPRRQRATRR